MLSKLVFTGIIAILGGIQRFSNSKKTLSHRLCTDSESAQKTESNEVSFKLISQFSLFFGVAGGLKFLHTDQKMKVVKLT